MPQNDERGQYCRQQAAECAAAAAAATVAPVREAYLNKQQRWLGLAPGTEDAVLVGPSSQPRDDDLAAEPEPSEVDSWATDPKSLRKQLTNSTVEKKLRSGMESPFDR
jgi:hypothetical protein